MKQFKRRVGLGILWCGLLSGGLLANPATAALVTFNFTGTVTNNFPLTGDGYGDGYMVASSYSRASFSTSRTPLALEFGLTGSTSSFSNTSLPTTQPSLSSFANPPTFRGVFTGGMKPIVHGALDSLRAVPLPTAVILFGAGFIALVGLGAGSWRQRENSLV